MNHAWWVVLDVVVAVAIGALVTFLGSRVVQVSFRRIDPPDVEAAARALPGGSWIGALERIAVYSALLAGWKEALAVVLAVKGLGRYPELRAGDTPAVAERFIIGTFISVLLACGAAALTLWLWAPTP